MTRKSHAAKEMIKMPRKVSSKVPSPTKVARDNNPESPMATKLSQSVKRGSHQIAAMMDTSDL